MARVRDLLLKTVKRGWAETPSFQSVFIYIHMSVMCVENQRGIVLKSHFWTELFCELNSPPPTPLNILSEQTKTTFFFFPPRFCILCKSYPNMKVVFVCLLPRRSGVRRCVRQGVFLFMPDGSVSRPLAVRSERLHLVGGTGA